MLQNKIKHDTSLEMYYTVTHHLCIHNMIRNHVRNKSPYSLSVLGCAVSNATFQKCHTPEKKNIVKRIQCTNVLTKMANQSNIYYALVEFSNATQVPLSHIHYAIVYYIECILDNPKNIIYLNVSFSCIERILQIYRKWMSEVSKDYDKLTKRLPKIKQQWRDSLKSVDSI